MEHLYLVSSSEEMGELLRYEWHLEKSASSRGYE